MPFMGALASMNGRSPEEKRRDERQRHKLQQSLKHQVNVKKNAATIKEIEELRLLLKSRQAKLDKGADHWGQRIPPNDPFGVRRQMVSDQESILNNIRDKQAQVEAFAKVTQNNAGDRLKAAEMEIQYMQEQRSTLQHQLEAFEAENMRLTNDIEELRFSSAQQQRQLDTVLAAPQRLGLEAPGDDNTTALLETRRADALRIAELEKQTRRLQNELDEAMNTRTEYKKNDVGTG